VFVSLIEIRLQYLVLGAQRKKTLVLSEDDYFDPEYELAGKNRIASVPLYQDARKYIPGDDPISATTVTLTDGRYRQRRVVSTSYWNHGQSELTEVRQTGADAYRELISTQRLKIAGKEGWLIERWLWESRWKPHACAFVELEDGTQRDHPIPVND
jgi:hypothetical protein